MEKERLEAEIAAKVHDPHARLAEIESEQRRRWDEEAAQRAEREDSTRPHRRRSRRHLPQDSTPCRGKPRKSGAPLFSLGDGGTSCYRFLLPTRPCAATSLRSSAVRRCFRP
jgi:hypothetical protein